MRSRGAAGAAVLMWYKTFLWSWSLMLLCRSLVYQWSVWSALQPGVSVNSDKLVDPRFGFACLLYDMSVSSLRCSIINYDELWVVRPGAVSSSPCTSHALVACCWLCHRWGCFNMQYVAIEIYSLLECQRFCRISNMLDLIICCCTYHSQVSSVLN